MKKFLLTLFCTVLALGAAYAQVNEIYEQVAYTAMSPNGRYLLEDNNANLRFLNRNTGESVSFEASEDLLTTYHSGVGKCVANDGMFVGDVSFRPAFYKDGEWTFLPEPQGKGSGMNSCKAVTPDGTRICGLLANDHVSIYDDGILAVPCVWTLQDNGDWECEILPYPALDFTRQAPQYITTTNISDDGKTIVGNLRDCFGAYNTLIVYQQADDGTWSYWQPATDLVYDAEKAKLIPDYPQNKEYPEAENYLTADQLKQYQADQEEYEEMYNLYLSGTITWDEMPAYPDPWKYMDEEHHTQWTADSAEYYDYQDTYWDLIIDYDEAREAATTGNQFVFNSVALSANGKWLATSLDNGNTVVVNLEDKSVRTVKTSEMLATSVTDDGMVVVCSPLSMGYTRVPYILKPDADSPISFKNWLEEIGQADALTVGFTGTTYCNSDGTIFLGFINPFADGDPCSYLLDLNKDAVTAISSARADEDNVMRHEFYNVAGQRISKPQRGVYIEKVFTSNGVKTYKRVK